MRADPFQGGQPHHLRLVEKQMPRTAFTGIDNKLSHRLAEQFRDWLARQLVSHIESVNVNDFANVWFGFPFA